MEFKMGDRVVCRGMVDGFYRTDGEVGTTLSIRGVLSAFYLVEFDNPIPGSHNGDGCGRLGHCLWVNPELLELVSEAKPLIPAAEREYITL